MKVTGRQLKKIILEASANRQSFGYYPPVNEEQRDRVLMLLESLKEVFSTSVTQEYLNRAEQVLTELDDYLVPY